MPEERKKRVLLVASDNVFESLDGVDVDFVGGFGRNMGRSGIQRGGEAVGRILGLLTRVLLRRYDRIVLPSLFVPFMARFDGSKTRRRLASLLLAGADSKFWSGFGRWGTRILFGRDRVAFIDRIECVYLHRAMFQYFDRAMVFKTNAWRATPGNEKVEVVPVPFWINAGCYPEGGGKPFEDRGREVFFAGAMCSRQRRLAPEVERIALGEGLDFYWPRERLVFEDFIDSLRDSKIAWSPEGSIWNCWRHLEALMYGAIPLINRPDPRFYHEFVDGESCFFYDDPAHAVEIMMEVVRGDLRLSMSQRERRDFVVDTYSAGAAGRKIAEQLKLTESGA